MPLTDGDRAKECSSSHPFSSPEPLQGVRSWPRESPLAPAPVAAHPEGSGADRTPDTLQRDTVGGSGGALSLAAALLVLTPQDRCPYYQQAPH